MSCHPGNDLTLEGSLKRNLTDASVLLKKTRVQSSAYYGQSVGASCHVPTSARAYHA